MSGETREITGKNIKGVHEDPQAPLFHINAGDGQLVISHNELVRVLRKHNYLATMKHTREHLTVLPRRRKTNAQG